MPARMATYPDTTPHDPGLDAIRQMAEVAFACLPADFRAACGRVVFRVADLADEETLDALDIEDPMDLSGVYHGASIASDLSSSPVLAPPEVWLYRLPILEEWREDGGLSLEELVEHVLVHEIAHHMGLSDDDIDWIESRDD